MQKLYTDVKPSSEKKKSPKTEVLNTILAFSKSLEVLKTENESVELILN